MTSSSFFNTFYSGSWRDDFPGSSAEIWQDYPRLRSAFVASPDQLPEPLPDPDSSSIWTQPSPIYPSTHEASPHPNTHIPFDFDGRPLQIDRQPVQYYTPFFNPQDSGPMSTVMPTTHQPSATLNAVRSLMYNGCSSAVGSSPVHHAFYFPQDHSTCAQSQYNGSQVFVDQTKPFNSTMGTPYRQIQPAPAGVVRSSSSVPSYLVFQPMVPHFPPAQVPPTRRNSRGNRSVTSSPYHPIRTSSLPVQSVSPKETEIHPCQWMRDDGTTCGAQITWTNLPQHLTTHRVKNMAHNHRLPCRWLGCRLRGDKATMNRESIVRHVREKHLGCKRTL